MILVADQLAATDVSEGATKKKQTRGLCHLVLILLILKKPGLDSDHIQVMYTVCCSLYVLWISGQKYFHLVWFTV